MLTDETMSDKFYEFVEEKSKSDIIEGMVEAIELMQQYNGRTVRYCLYTAFGLTEVEDGRWQYPKKIRESNFPVYWPVVDSKTGERTLSQPFDIEDLSGKNVNDKVLSLDGTPYILIKICGPTRYYELKVA